MTAAVQPLRPGAADARLGRDRMPEQWIERHRTLSNSILLLRRERSRVQLGVGVHHTVLGSRVGSRLCYCTRRLHRLVLVRLSAIEGHRVLL